MKEAVARVSLKAESSTPDALAERIREDYEFFRRVVKIANVKTD